MGGSHWLLLIPFYFFAALTLSLLGVLGARLFRSGVSINTVASSAVAISFAAVSVPILAGWLRIADYTTGGMVILLLLSAVLALANAVLEPHLPVQLDRELRDL